MTSKKEINGFFYGASVLLYIIFITITFYSDTALPKIVSMGIIPMAFLLFLIVPDFERAKKLIGFPLIMIVGILISYALSLAIWIVNVEETKYIIAGTERIVYQIINVLVAFCAVYMFGSKAADYTLYGAFLMNSIKMVQGLVRYGIAGSFRDIWHAFLTGEQEGFMAMLEIHVVTYVFGLFIIYYLFADNCSTRKKTIHIIGCLIFAFLGFKRINFAAVFLSFVLAFACFKLFKRHMAGFALAVGITTAVIAFFYIPFIKYGVFEYVMNYFNIETNTRIAIYNYVSDIYTFSPNFAGRGIDFIVRYLKYLKTLNLEYAGSSLEYIHNDILVKYIEMGFFGFIGWLYSVCIFCCRWLRKKCGGKAAAMYAIMTAACFINYSVGNTNRAYAVRLVVAIIVMATIAKNNIENESLLAIKGGE